MAIDVQITPTGVAWAVAILVVTWKIVKYLDRKIELENKKMEREIQRINSDLIVKKPEELKSNTLPKQVTERVENALVGLGVKKRKDEIGHKLQK